MLRALRRFLQRQPQQLVLALALATYVVPPGLTESMVKAADHLMYSVKNGSKNGITFAVECDSELSQRGSSNASSAV